MLVTGGAGFIGSNLAWELVRRGFAVRVLDNFATGHRSNLAGLQGEAEVIEGDIQSYERASRAIAGCEAVLHQAALPSVPRSVQDPLTSNATNVIGTLNVLLAARDHGVRRVVVASSSSVYGSNPSLPKHEEIRRSRSRRTRPPSWPAENYARSFHGVYGWRRWRCATSTCSGRARTRGPSTPRSSRGSSRSWPAASRPVIFGDGEQSRDFTYVDNVVAANLLALESDRAAGRVYNVACGTRITLNQLLAHLNDLLGTDLLAGLRGATAGGGAPFVG